MGHYCCFKDCKHSSRNTNCRFFRFPVKDVERAMKWIERSGNESLRDLSMASLSTKHVCSTHFGVNQILGTGRLFCNSIPNPYTQSSDTAAIINPSALDGEPSQVPTATDIIPPFIVVNETIDFVVELIDEDVEEEELASEEEVSASDVGLSALVAECGEVLINNDEPADDSDDVEEVDPLAMETDDTQPNDDSPQLFTNLEDISTPAAFNESIHYQRDHSVTEVFHIIETVMDEETPPSSEFQELPGTWCVVQDLQQNPFYQLPHLKRREVVAVGRPTPTIELCGPGKIKFGKEQYDKHDWVTGSSVLQKIFCWPCLLFSKGDKDSDWGHKGFGGHPGLEENLLSHENSKIHLANSAQLAMLKEKSAHNGTVKKKRDVLQRMIDAVCLLAKAKIPFRSHFDTNSSLLHGTYLDLINTLSQFDRPLKNHLETKNINTLTCSRIRNGLTDSITAVMLKKIKREVKESKFASIILYEPSDSMDGSQMATIVRYIDPKGNPSEHFIRYEDIGSDYGVYGRGLDVVERIIEEFEIRQKLVAVSYSGRLIGLCDEIRDRYPHVWFINNLSDQLSSDLLKVCYSIKECQFYLVTISSIASFFSTETKTEKLNVFIIEKLMECKLPTTQGSNCSGKFLYDVLPQALDFFKTVIENPKNWPVETVLKAQGYRYFLEDFSNTFLLVVFARIFRYADELDELLQKREIAHGLPEIKECIDKTREFKNFLKTESLLFDEVWEQVKLKRMECNLEPLPLKNSIVTYLRRPSTPGDLQDHRTEYKHLFLKIIACFTNHITHLNAYLVNLQINSLINLGEINKLNENFPLTSFQVLMKIYPEFFHETHLKKQLAVLYQFTQFKCINRFDFISHMKSIHMEIEVPEVYTLACLCLTIPGAKPSREISFTATNRIKYVSETLGQHHKAKLAQLAIENDFLCELKREPNFYSEVLDEFAKLESSSMEFTYL